MSVYSPVMWLNVNFESKCKLKVIVFQLTIIVGLALPERLSVQRVEHLLILREQLASGFPGDFSGCIFPRKRQTEDSTRRIRTTLSWPLFGKITSQHNNWPFLPLLFDYNEIDYLWFLIVCLAGLNPILGAFFWALHSFHWIDPYFLCSHPGNSLNRLKTCKPGGVGGYSHTLPIRVCAAQRGRDFEAPDLERGIHFRGVF